MSLLLRVNECGRAAGSSFKSSSQALTEPIQYISESEMMSAYDQASTTRHHYISADIVAGCQ